MTQLAADPVFQLNTVLWMLQPSPAFPHAIDAVLYKAGYSVRQLGGRLTAPAHVEALLAQTLGLRGVPAPDVLADAPDADPRLVFECKASSFGRSSSTAEQAQKVLARAVDLSLAVGAALGKTVPGAVVYLTRDDQTGALAQTLMELTAQFDEHKVPTAPTSVLGVSAEPGEGVIVSLSEGTLPGRAGDVLAEPCVVVPAAGDGEVARPLYLVPYDPSVEQTDEERDRCLRVLLERARTHITSLIGRAAPPTTVVVDGMQVLADATYGLSAYWLDISARDAAARRALGFAKTALRQLKPTAPEVTERSSNPPRLEVRLTSAVERDAAANGLMAAVLPGDLDALDDAQQELILFPGENDRPE